MINNLKHLLDTHRSLWGWMGSTQGSQDADGSSHRATFHHLPAVLSGKWIQLTGN